MRKHSTPAFWLPWMLVLAMSVLLGACGTTDSASTTTQSTVVPTSPPRTATGTLPIAPSASAVPTKPTVPLTAISMLDARNGWALTKSALLKTADGGLHWTDVTPARAELNQSARGQFLNTQDAWIAIGPANQQEGPGISVLYTLNGGTSWQRSLIPDSGVSLVDVPHFINVRQGWLAISSTPGAGSARTDIWYTNSSGQSWTSLASSKSINDLNLAYITGISFRNAQVGIATGNLGAGGNNTVPVIALTQDGGQSWHTQALPPLAGSYANPMYTSQPPVFFGNVVLMPVTVMGPDGSRLALYRSNNSGVNWFQTGEVGIQADNTYVVDTAHAWATDTSSGKLYATSDGGAHWSLTSNTAYQLQALSFIDTQNGWGVTSDQLLHTTDGGQIWQPIPYTFQ